MDIPVQRSARLIILDPDDRLLLFRYHDEHRPPFWSTPGGRLEPGERYVDAAARELREETGFDAAAGPLLHVREAVYAVARAETARWIEHYFLVRCAAGAPSHHGWTDEERATIRGERWWSLDEMRATNETFLPPELPGILADALAGITPGEAA